MRVWLKELRNEKSLTMKEAAEALGISESYYCAIENGERQKRMDIVLVAEIAALFGRTISEIAEMETMPLNHGKGTLDAKLDT